LNEHYFHGFCFAKSVKIVFVQNIIWRLTLPNDDLRPFYATPYCFAAKSIKKEVPDSIESSFCGQRL